MVLTDDLEELHLITGVLEMINPRFDFSDHIYQNHIPGTVFSSTHGLSD